MKTKFINIAIIAIIASLSVVACNNFNSDTAKKTELSMSYKNIVAQANDQHSMAKEKWNNTWQQKKMEKSYVDTYLAQAAEAKKAGNATKAIELAKQALNTANQEVNQMRTESKPAWLK